MSSVYIRNIRRIGREYEAARGALAYTERNWQKMALFNDSELEHVGPQDLRNAVNNLEATFIIRIFAAYEGMLKEHLMQHHAHIAVPEDARAVWLIDRVSTLQSPHIGTPLRNRVHDVRRHRNSLVHAVLAAPLPMTFDEVRSRLNTYLDKLPEPLR